MNESVRMNADMRMIPSDPDIQTIVSRIDSGDIILRPNFQRGEVWNRLKKQKLIDSILRDWHIPPVHVIENVDTEKQEVLDGQQRLTAIRDFIHDAFPVDGLTEPFDPIISALDGLLFSQLDQAWKKRVNHYAIRLFRLIEYKAGEPWELFFRLNQSTRLTGAEERNAFFGPVREQIKTAVAYLQRLEFADQYLGFSNARMAYDDVLSRTALAIDRSSLAEKLTAGDLTELFRREEPLAQIVMDRLLAAVATMEVLAQRRVRPPRMNKAMVFTWLMFIVRATWSADGHLYEHFLNSFEVFIEWFTIERHRLASSSGAAFQREEAQRAWLIFTLDDRGSSRVADISSVLLRDAIVWRFFIEFADKTGQAKFSYADHAKLSSLSSLMNDIPHLYEEDDLARRLVQMNWGDLP